MELNATRPESNASSEQLAGGGKYLRASMAQPRAILLVLLAALALNGRAGGPQIIENKGQWPGAVTYQAALDGAILWFERDGLLIDLFDAKAAAETHGQVGQRPLERIRRHAVRLRFTSALADNRCTADSALAGEHHYLLGTDHRKWVRHARAFRQVRMEAVAPGCDAVFRLNGGAAKYDLHVRPGADVNKVRFTYEGASAVSLRGATLLVETTLGRITEHIPIAYQVIEGRHVPVSCSYRAFKDGYGFVVGAYDQNIPLIIDPTLAFATYSGSFSNNFGYTATFDRAGFLYAGSTAFGNQYPTTTGAYQTSFAGGTGQGGNGGTDIVVTKYDTTGTFLVWSTYLGGSRDEMPHSLIVDDNDELLLLGTTGSTDFPMVPGAFDDTFSGGSAVTPSGLGVSFPTGTDMVLARLSADGSLLRGSTYLGGSANDGINTAAGLRFNYADEVRGEVLLDEQGRVWVVSCTQSTNAPVTPDAVSPSYRGGAQDGYVARFNATLTTLQYASFIGGAASDACYNGALGQDGRLYLCGGTTSTDLPASANAARPTNAGGSAEGFVARLVPGLASLDALTYWGSPAYDQVYFIELDATDNPFLFGQTTAPAGQLIQGATYQVPGGGQFITKLSPDLSSVLLGTRFGSGDGTPDISPTAFLVDVCNKIYTSGWGSTPGLGGSLSTNGLPVTQDAHQSTTDGNDLYLAVFDIDMSDLTYATYYGGGISPEHVDGGTSRFDRRGRVYQSVCAGCQNNDDFPTSPGAWSATNNSSGCNNGVLKFDLDAPLVIAAFQAPDTLCAQVPLSFVNLSSGASGVQWDFGDGNTSSLTTPAHTYASPGTYTITLTATHPLSCNGQDSAQRTIIILPQAPVIQAMQDTLNCGPMVSLPLVAFGDGTVDAWHWSSQPDFGDTLNGTPLDSVAVLQPVISGTYFVRASNGSGCASIDSVVVRAPFAEASLIAENRICLGDTVVICSFEAGYPTIWEPVDEIIDVVNNGHCVLVAPDGDTEIFATLAGPFGCAWSGSIVIQVSPLSGSTVTATANATTVLPGTTVQLLATPASGVTYNWQPAVLVSDPTSANPTASVQRTTTFTVTVSDGICTRDARVTVLVYGSVCGMPDIFVPNTFTPNNDGTNDRLFVRGNNIARMEFLVFDRWGELIFSTTQQDQGWDGTFRGRPADPAVFVYHLTVDCADGQRYFTKGNISLLR
jgi:gliding motility-associated-like protein